MSSDSGRYGSGIQHEEGEGEEEHGRRGCTAREREGILGIPFALAGAACGVAEAAEGDDDRTTEEKRPMATGGKREAVEVRGPRFFISFMGSESTPGRGVHHGSLLDPVASVYAGTFISK
ncbi:unnamed protein product [Discosporangium mesarthrocarpum]